MGEEHEEGRSGEGDKRLGQRGDESRPKQPRHSHEQQYGSEFGAHDDADDHICVLLVEQLLKEAEARGYHRQTHHEGRRKGAGSLEHRIRAGRPHAASPRSVR